MINLFPPPLSSTKMFPTSSSISPKSSSPQSRATRIPTTNSKNNFSRSSKHTKQKWSEERMIRTRQRILRIFCPVEVRVVSVWVAVLAVVVVLGQQQFLLEIQAPFYR